MRRSPTPPEQPISMSSGATTATSSGGDLYIISAESGEQFHLSVGLSDQRRRITRVSTAALRRTIDAVLLPVAPPSQLSSRCVLLHGQPMGCSDTDLLPDGAVVVVHRGSGPLQEMQREALQPKGAAPRAAVALAEVTATAQQPLQHSVAMTPAVSTGDMQRGGSPVRSSWSPTPLRFLNARLSSSSSSPSAASAGNSTNVGAPPTQAATTDASPTTPPLPTDEEAMSTAAALEQQAILRRWQLHCGALEKKRQRLLEERQILVSQADTAARLEAMRAAQEAAAAAEVDAARAKLGATQAQLCMQWSAMVQQHHAEVQAMDDGVAAALAKEGEEMILKCMSLMAGYETQQMRLQRARLKREQNEATLQRLTAELQQLRSSTSEKVRRMGVVARLRPPSQPSWLPAAGALPADADRGFAITVHAAHSSVETRNPVTGQRRHYPLSAAYGASTSQQQLFKEQLEPLLEHLCRTGQSILVLADGALGSGKTYAIVGQPFAERQALIDRCSSGGTSMERRPPHHEICSEDGDVDHEEEEEDSEEGIRCRKRSSPPRKTPVGLTEVPVTYGAGASAVSARAGISPCAHPEDAVLEAAVLESMAVAAAKEKAERAESHRDSAARAWRQQSGLHEAGDGLLPRAVAWLTAQLRCHRCGALEGTLSTTAAPLEALYLSMYEVYADHVYDLLGEGFTKPQLRWNDGLAPAPHVKHSNPNDLTELTVEAVECREGEDTSSAPLRWRVRATELPVQSPVAALERIHEGLKRRRTATTARGVQSSRSHLFVRLRVEMAAEVLPPEQTASPLSAVAEPCVAQRAATDGAATLSEQQQRQESVKGAAFLRTALRLGGGAAGAGRSEEKPVDSSTPATRSAEVLFCDLAGSGRIDALQLSGDALKEAQYVKQSLRAVREVLAAVATHPPNQAPYSKGEEKKRGSQTVVSSSPTGEVALHDVVARWDALSTAPGIVLASSVPVLLQPRLDGASDTTLRRASEVPGSALRRKLLAQQDKELLAQGVGDAARPLQSTEAYIPFRASKATQLLHHVLCSRSSRVLVLACMHPCSVSEVVLPPKLHGKKGKKVREAALKIFGQQAPLMLSDAGAVLALSALVAPS